MGYKRKIFFILFILIISSAILLPSCISKITAYSVVKTFRKPVFVSKVFVGVSSPDELQMKYQDLSFESFDGAEMRYWYIPSGESKRTIIILHGHNDNKVSYLKLAKSFYNCGFNTVLIDLRAHGKSEGKYCTFGVYEKIDLKILIDSLIVEKNLNEFGVMGISLGAAIAIQFASYDNRVKAVISQSSFSSLKEIVPDYAKRFFTISYASTLASASLSEAGKIANFNPEDASPIDAVKKINCPILFVHGALDNQIKTEYSKLLYKECASEDKELLLIESAKHNNVIRVGGEKYLNKLCEFFEENL